MRDTEYAVFVRSVSQYKSGGTGGYGVIIHNNSIGTDHEISEGYENTNAIRMELMGVIAALMYLPKRHTIKFYVSKAMIPYLSGRKDQESYPDLYERLDALLDTHPIVVAKDLEWGNHDIFKYRCEQLATAALDYLFLKEDEANPESKHNATGKINNSPSYSNDIKQPAIEDLLIPSELDVPYNNYKGIQVNDSCTQMIQALPMEASKKALSKVKVGKRDQWSKLEKDKLTSLFRQKTVMFLCTLFPSQTDLYSCLRWYGRGMSLRNAIVKTNIEVEILQKRIKSYYEGNDNNS